MRTTVALAACLSILVSACAQPSQNRYDEQDVGHNALILYGIVKSERQVDISAKNSGTGALAGAAAGAIGGSAIGQGRGSLLGLVGGLVVGGIAGAAAEQALKDRVGIEYVIKFPQTGLTQSVVQNIAKSDKPIPTGQCVMVQMSGSYQRVLPDNDDSDCRAPEPKHSPLDDNNDQ